MTSRYVFSLCAIQLGV